MTDPRDARIEALEHKLDALTRLLAERDAQLAQRDAQLAKALARIDVLEEQLRRSSKNSSKPPSSDRPKDKPRRIAKPTGRRPGGQPGHTKHERPLATADKVTKRIVCKPSRCRGCAGPLSGNDVEPRRHHVWELPVAPPLVTEYLLHTLRCSRCDVHTPAELPPGVPTRSFGPRVEATAALLMGVYRISKRGVAAILGDLFQLPLSVGAVSDSQQVVSDALRVPYEEACEAAQAAPIKNADETGWWEGHQRAWLWTVVTSVVTVFAVRAHRSAEVARELLGRPFGLLGTDRYGAYAEWAVRSHQVCWAHLLRDFRAIGERRGEGGRVGRALLEEATTLFAWWHQVKAGTLTRFHFTLRMHSLQTRVEALLVAGLASPHKQTAGTCKKILSRAPSLWTFVREEGIEPTNNVSERALRHAVLWRKSSFGTHSEEGSRFVERILTVKATLQEQGRDVITYLVAARNAALFETNAPSLLPASPRASRPAA